MSKVKRLLATFMAVCMITSMLSVTAFAGETPPALSGVNVTAAGDATTVKKGDTLTLTANAVPTGATLTAGDITWTSSDTSIVDVANTKTATNIVTGKAAGTAVITATLTDSKSASYTLTVPVPADRIQVKGETTLNLNETETLVANVLPSNAADRSVVWTTDDASIVAVDSATGVITAKKVGYAKITATANGIATGADAVTAYCDVTVKPLKVTGVTIDPAAATIVKGDTRTLTSKVTPVDAESNSVIWRSSNTSVATVKDGKVTAVAAGTATITAISTTSTEVEGTCEITVIDPVEANAIIMDKEVSVTNNSKGKINVSLTPAGTTGTIVWKSSNSDVVKADSIKADGSFEALEVGETTITATVGNLQATCKVTVTAVKVTGVTIAPASSVLGNAAEETITAIITPENATDKTVKFEIETPKTNSPVTIAPGVDVGKTNTCVVTADAAKNGKATITATTTDGKFVAKYEVEVVGAVPATSVTIKETPVVDTTPIEVIVGAKQKLTTTYAPSNTTEKMVWSTTGDDKIVKVAADGTVTAVGTGEATVTVTMGNVNDTIKFKVVEPTPVTKITFNMKATTIVAGMTDTIVTIVEPSTATNKTLTWTTSDEKVATVADGVITAVAPGKATISAKSGKVETKCEVTVTAVAVESIKLNKTASTILVGKKDTIAATVMPENATDKKVTWTSSNPAVATVKDGVVTAVKAGEAVITAASSAKGITATCKIIVKNPVIAATKVTLDKTAMAINLGKTATLKATVAPANATNKSIRWASTNTKVATVSSKGVVTAKSGGKATIYAIVDKPNYVRGGCVVTVNVPATSVKVSKTSMLVAAGKTATLKATVAPSNATNKSIRWASTNTSVATVSSKGVITAKKPGVAMIYAIVDKPNYVRGGCKLTVVPATPTSVTAKKATSTSSKITWKPATGASGYAVYCSTSKTGGFKLVKTMATSKAPSFTHSKLTKGKTYYYKVSAFTTIGGKRVYSAASSAIGIRM